MNFKRLDPALMAWAAKNQVGISTKYQDVEVRSVELVGPIGRAQIWVEVNDQVTVHAWDYRKRKQLLVATEATLEARLDEALLAASNWCGMDQAFRPLKPVTLQAAMDYYAEAGEIARCLEQDGLAREAQDLRDAIGDGSTGTEILMALRWHLQRMDKARPATSPETLRQIRSLTAAIGAVLGP